jgi:hypothetical protein
VKKARSLRLLAFVLAFGLGGCDALLTDPAPPGTAAFSLEVITAGSAGGPSAAFDKADAVFIQVRSGGAVRVETTIPLTARGGDVPISLEVPLNEAQESFTIEVEVRLGAAVLFRGSAEQQLGVGFGQSVLIVLDPVVTGVVLPASLPTLTAYGDQVTANAARVFATGDTASVVPVESWTSLDPEIVSITAGIPVARADGTARLVGAIGTFRDTLTVQVLATVATVTIADAGPLDVGASRQYSAQLRDRRGNPIPGRTITWSSGNTSVLTIVQATGLATGVSAGSAVITATSVASGTLTVVVQVRTPSVTTDAVTGIGPTSATFNATVQPNGQATEAWFDYDLNPTFAQSTSTSRVAVPAGTTPAPVSLNIAGLLSNRTYYVRSRATNAAGSATGNTVQFTTPLVPFSAVTTGATNIGSFSARINGLVYTTTTAARGFFLLGTDPLLRDVGSFGGFSVPAGAQPFAASYEIREISSNTTYYFRICAQEVTSQQSVCGAILSFRTLPPILTNN